jgi:hypothetical protein
MQPRTAIIVATNQRRDGRSPRTKMPNNPAHTGPLPMVTTVPTATPVRATPAKKNGW